MNVSCWMASIGLLVAESRVRVGSIIIEDFRQIQLELIGDSCSFAFNDWSRFNVTDLSRSAILPCFLPQKPQKRTTSALEVFGVSLMVFEVALLLNYAWFLKCKAEFLQDSNYLGVIGAREEMTIFRVLMGKMAIAPKNRLSTAIRKLELEEAI